MAVRKQRSTTKMDIIEKDIKEAIKKAKIRFRGECRFYIFKDIVSNDVFYGASSYPDGYPFKEIYHQKWVFKDKRWVNVTQGGV